MSGIDSFTSCNVIIQCLRGVYCFVTIETHKSSKSIAMALHMKTSHCKTHLITLLMSVCWSKTIISDCLCLIKSHDFVVLVISTWKKHDMDYPMNPHYSWYFWTSKWWAIGLAPHHAPLRPAKNKPHGQIFAEDLDLMLPMFCLRGQSGT